MRYYYLGMTFGMLLAVGSAFVVWWRQGKRATFYDERQQLARGRGFQYAYMTAAALLMLYACVEEQTERYVSPGVIPIAILLVSGLVLFAYSVFRDAYWGYHGTKGQKWSALLWGFLGILMALQARENILCGKLRMNGRFSLETLLPLMLSVFFFGMLLIALAKHCLDCQEEG
mgnify:FL=1